VLQLQMRDLHGFLESRRRILNNKQAQKGNWIAYIIACHLNRDFTRAKRLLEVVNDNFRGIDEDQVECSERRLYHALVTHTNSKVLEESGDFQAAVDFLQTHNNEIRDRVAYMERMADLSLKLGHKEESLSWWSQLLLRNPDELRYHQSAAAALGLPPLNATLTAEQLDTLNQFWKPIREAHPRSATFDGLQLSCSSGAEFEALFEKRLCNQLRKGIPSLFGGMRHLYSVPEKVAAIEGVILKAEKSLREQQVLPDRAPDSEKEPPTTLLWLLCYLALHFNERGQFERALDYLREGHDEHTPTMHELYMIKANVLKHTGALAEASAQLEYVRKLDTADRFLNTKSVKYLLAANQPEEATAVVQLFTKDNDDFDPAEKGQSYLDYMQAMWWESRLAACYDRLGRLDEALSVHCIILGHFKGIIEDQFDFHSYVLRKMTIRAYTQLLRFADNIYTHKQYRLAARGAIRVALKLEKKRAAEPPKGTSSILNSRTSTSRQTSEAASHAGNIRC
jgi:tetratricopeptide (TPR) repeat protein